jgi:hypothetical protein
LSRLRGAAAVVLQRHSGQRRTGRKFKRNKIPNIARALA